MSGGQIPAYIDVRRAFQHDTELTGLIELDRLPRFAGSLAGTKATIRVDLQFSVADNGDKCIQGHLQVATELTCQRCLEPLESSWEDDIALVVLVDETLADKLDPEWDPYIWEEPKLILAELIEEQLLLSMPIVSYHPDAACADKLGYKPAPEISEPVGQTKENPFSVLKALKQNDETD